MCQHLKFNAQVHVHRIVEDNRLTFNAELAVRCGECGEVFEFLGMQTGISQTQPTTGINGTTARLPIAPARLRQEQAPPADKPMVPGIRQNRVRKSIDDVPRPPRLAPIEVTPIIARPILDITDVVLSVLPDDPKQLEAIVPTPEPVIEQAPPTHIPEPVIERAPEPHSPAPEQAPEPAPAPSTPTE